MGRYADFGQEILYRGGKFLGFNAGYSAFTEHECGYKGLEQINREKEGKEAEHPFSREIVRNPENNIFLIELSDGTVLLTNDGFFYSNLMAKSEDERQERITNMINNDERKRINDFKKQIGMPQTHKSVCAFWSSGDFKLISEDETGKKILKELYQEMQRKNVAISADYSFLFEDRGLSFVILDRLGKEDFIAKQMMDNREELARRFEQEYKEYLKSEGISDFDTEYPLQFFNLQIGGVVQEGEKISPKFYLELYDRRQNEYGSNTHLYNVPHKLMGDEIKFLVPLVKSEEFLEFAKTHTKEEMENFINERLEKYREEEKIKREQEYTIGEESLDKVAEGQRIGNIRTALSSLKYTVNKWLHAGRNKETKEDEKGE